MVPSTDLVPPIPDNADTELSQQIQNLANKTSTEGSSNEDKTGKESSKKEEQTAEPLGPIVITDPPMTTVDSAATAGKWPITEVTTESNEGDDENETK